MLRKSCSEMIRLWNCREFLVYRTLAPERLAMSHLVRGHCLLCSQYDADRHSTFPKTLDPPKDANCHFAHPDFPRLFPLSHQSIQGLYSLTYAKANGRLPSRFVFPNCTRWNQCLLFLQCCVVHAPIARKKRGRLQVDDHSRSKEAKERRLWKHITRVDGWRSRQHLSSVENSTCRRSSMKTSHPKIAC